MSKIKINQISDSELEVLIDADVPLAMVEGLNKSLQERGLIQDDSASSISKRVYRRYNPYEVEDKQERLLKSLENMVKADAQTKLAWEQARQSRLVDRNSKRKDMGMAPINMDQFKNPVGATPPSAITPSASPKGPATLPGVANKLHNPGISGNYASKNEDGHTEGDPKCGCEKCSSVRKANLNKSLREKLNGGTAWTRHNPFPSGQQPNSGPLPTAEQLMANQLANVMMGKNMMKAIPGAPLLGSNAPPQPTDQQMFGHLVPSEEQLKKAESGYHNGFNNFLNEVTKPLNSRFANEAEEMAYWASIKVNGGSDSAE